MPRRWYQTIEIDGINAVFEDYNRKFSKFWNEGKWDNFIKPLLPKERQTFIELGCNAGLYLKMAKDEGFKRVIGVEARGGIIAQAESYKKSINGEYELVHKRAGVDLDLKQLPVADLTLIANMHYYLPVSTFSDLTDELRNRTLYCIIVSAKARNRQGHAKWTQDHTRGYFRDWEEIASIENIDPEGDPSPRPDMFGILFKGNLESIDVQKMFNDWYEASKSWKHKSRYLAPAMMEFLEQAVAGEKISYEDTSFFDYLRTRGTHSKRTPEFTRDWLIYKESLVNDIRDNGIKEPIYIGNNGKLLDGLFRMSIAKLLGYKHIPARIL
jgi:hypothetical protein